MKIGKFLTALIAPVWLYAPAQSTFFEADFAGGKMPAGMQTANTGVSVPDKNLYRHGFTADGWTVERVGAKGYAAVAPSRTPDSEELTAVLSTPQFLVEADGACLRWEARSMLPGFPEAYDVAVMENGSGEWNTILSIDAEDCRWKTRLLPLGKYSGKEISVAFVCHGGDTYMLAVRSIFAGIPESPVWSLNDNTPRFAAFGDDGMASGTLTNLGAEATDVTIVCRSGEEVEEILFPGAWPTGEEREFSTPLTLSPDTPTEYALSVRTADGAETPLGESEVFASNFERTLLIDEGTGMWCNNCPDGILALDKLKQEFGDRAVELSCHVNDALACNEYWSHLGFYAIPYMKLNRDDATAGSDASRFSNAYNRPTIAHIALQTERNPSSGSIGLHSTVRFAEETDNSSGRYRIGYAVTADFFAPDSITWYQSNNISFPRGEQYYFLPTRIPSKLARFDNVVCEGSYAFYGIEGSLPSAIPAMEPVTYMTEVNLPDITAAAESVRIVAFVLDTQTRLVENAASVEISGDSGVGLTDAEGQRLTVSVSARGELRVTGAEPDETVTVAAYTTAGRKLFGKELNAAEAGSAFIPLPSGPVIVSVQTRSATARCKAIIRH